MKLSIVIPTLNEEKYIGNLLNCLVNQVYKDFEVLVVDGDSRDKTKNVVLTFEDKLDISFIQSPERGVSFQRNYGAEKARCNYIVFFDADLKIKDHFLSKLILIINKRKPSIVTSYLKPQSKRIIHYIIMFLYDMYLEFVRFLDPIATGSFICVKKEHFFEVGGFDKTLAVAEDYYLSRQMHEKGYKYALLRFPVPEYSMRRFEKIGLKAYLKDAIKISKIYYKKGKVSKEEDINYEFGEF